MKKFHSALFAITTLAIAFSFTACEKKQVAPTPVEPAKKQEYKSQPKPQAQPEQKPAQTKQTKQATSYNK